MTRWPNGAWANLSFTNAAGAPLVGSGVYVDANGLNINYVDGVPVSTANAGVVNGLYLVYLRFRTTEKLVLTIKG